MASSSSAGLCPICCDSYTGYKRKSIKCTHCEFTSCQECLKKYLLSINEEPHCMNDKCNVLWDREFLYNNFTKTFLTCDYKKHRENILIEREKSLLMATMPYVEREKQREILEENIRNKHIQIQELRDLINNIQIEIVEERNEFYINYDNINLQKVKFNYIKNCPNNNCNGFIDEDFICKLCNAKICKHCHEILENIEEKEHECDPNILENVKTIKKETKPCPSCNALIYKIDGCDQMYCTECNTAFSWRTGLIVKGVIHNPHYYEYLRKINNGVIPRNPGDIPGDQNNCDNNELPPYNLLLNILKINNVPKSIHDYITNMHRVLNHVLYDEIPRYTLPNTNGVEKNLDLRMKFLLNKITEEQWKFELQKREKRDNNYKEHKEIFEMIYQVGKDLLKNYIYNNENNNIKSNKNIIKLLSNNNKNLSIENILINSFEELRNHANNSFKNLADIYNRISPILINKRWMIASAHILSNYNDDDDN